ncbi:hypothetical protein B0H14DRAFT_3478474 [Mycena olivaceomarginata]|nr:hypothetical protein B0H14DRAFT_3478474 [Mycena olivaceomarginata]
MKRGNSGMHKGSGTSGRLRMFGSERKPSHTPGQASVKTATLSRRGVDEYRQRVMGGRSSGRTPASAIFAEDDDFHAGDAPNFPNMMNADLSHAGGELGSLEDDIEEDLAEEDNRQGSKREDWRTRRDRTEIRNRAFLSQMPEMVLAYIQEDEVEEMYEIQVVDMFKTSTVEVKLDSRAKGQVPALILAQMIPCAPWRPTMAIRTRVLEAYRVIHVRCPQLAIQAYIKSLCDLHGVLYRPHLCEQFSIAYNLYLDLRRRTNEHVMRALGRDSTWRLKHACPACTYKLEDEDTLIFDMLSTMDGNDSLKRVLRRVKVTMAGKRDGGAGAGEERVEKWVKDRVADRLPMQMASTDELNPCADRWKNMINDVTSKMWGIFDETGIFLALCRHGFVLVIADMIKRGELAKYPLAVVKELLDVFGMKLGVGYNIRYHFEATVASLRFLATYMEGMGLEDLEGCERFFSRSNGLAKSCRYASRFHRQQEITTYTKHFDSFETYPNLSKFLCANYTGLGDPKDGGGPPDWLVEEKAYLEGLKDAAKTNEETLAMEYVQKLVNLSASQYGQISGRGGGGATSEGVSGKDWARRHVQEKMEKDLDRVQELEETLGIVERWTTESPKWTATVEDIKRRKYNIALNALELLIVERIFELTKMNQVQNRG